MKHTLFIYGYGGFGREIYDIAIKSVDFDKVLFIDDNKSPNEIVMSFDSALTYSRGIKSKFILGIGDTFVRKQVIKKLIFYKLELANVICSSAIISPFANIGKGVLICSFCIVGPRSNIDSHVVMNIQSIVGHDISIGVNTVLSSQVNIGGGTKVGSDCYIGMSSIVKECLIIGDGSVLGMGSSLHRDLDGGYLAMGNPARPIRKLEDDFRIFNTNI
jgi:sugar O-acyltransferase (sialic acid O-acetyltransferase NeuD family)